MAKEKHVHNNVTTISTDTKLDL